MRKHDTLGPDSSTPHSAPAPTLGRALEIQRRDLSINAAVKNRTRHVSAAYTARAMALPHDRGGKCLCRMYRVRQTREG